MTEKAIRIETPCPYCGREEDGHWFQPCPSDDCPSNKGENIDSFVAIDGGNIRE